MSKTKKILLVIAAIVALFVVIQIANAAKYRMTVNVVDGENIVGLNPLTDKLDFGDLSRNNGITRHISLQSGGRISTYVIVWQFGELTELVKLNKNFFTLEPAKEERLSFEVRIPPSAETRTYSGWVWIFRLPTPF